jgi:hypothetical protein
VLAGKLGCEQGVAARGRLGEQLGADEIRGSSGRSLGRCCSAIGGPNLRAKLLRWQGVVVRHNRRISDRCTIRKKRDEVVRPISPDHSIPHFGRIFPSRGWSNPCLLQPNGCISGMIPSHTRCGSKPNTR